MRHRRPRRSVGWMPQESVWMAEFHPPPCVLDPACPWHVGAHPWVQMASTPLSLGPHPPSCSTAWCWEGGSTTSASAGGCCLSALGWQKGHGFGACVLPGAGRQQQRDGSPVVADMPRVAPLAGPPAYLPCLQGLEGRHLWRWAGREDRWVEPPNPFSHTKKKSIQLLCKVNVACPRRHNHPLHMTARCT